MNYSDLDRPTYNTLLSDAYERIYRQNGRAWGNISNSDLRRLVPRPSGRILDFGCGYGKNLSHLLCGGAYVYAVDLCSFALELAEHQFHRYIKVGRLKLIKGDELSDIPLCDLVVCSGVLVDHINPRRKRIAQRMCDYLLPGGRLLITVFGSNDPTNGLGSRVESNTYVHHFGFPVHYFNTREITRLYSGMNTLALYTRIKEDWYPNPHTHETHVLFYEKKLPTF